ncbi:MAG: glycosyltransferase family 4 protein [Actinobacteria bacterium]|nr:glycosyltransferase family 4 protein [Actinomycetota bacterium]
MSSTLRVGMDVRCLASGQLRGFGRYTAELLWGLNSQAGIELVAYADAPMDLWPGSPDLTIHTPQPGREWHREQVGLPRLLRELEVDVTLGPANRGLPLLGPPSVLTLHDAVEWDRAMVERPSGKSRVRFAYSNFASLTAAARIITVSSHAAAEIQRTLGLDHDRIRVVGEAPARVFTVLPDVGLRRRVREQLSLAGPYLLYVGGLDKKKSVDTLVAAWARLDPLVTPILALACGQAAVNRVERVRLEGLVRHAGGEPNRLVWLDYVPDELLGALYSEAEAFVFPAVAEGFGLPPVEAMASGTATVVADSAGLPAATRRAALLFEPYDVAGLATVIHRLMGAVEWRREVADRGRRAVLKRSWSDVACDTTKVLREAVGVSTSTRWAVGAGVAARAPRWL